MIGITILGATGSIGINTLDVLSRHRDRFQVIALTANTETDRLFDQCLTWQPRYAAVADETAARRLRQRLRDADSPVEVLAGVAGLEQVAALDETDYVMAGIVGAAGLLPTLAAARSGKRLLLANKEALVMSGAIFMEEVRRGGAELLPIDSEHNAVFQCMPSGFARGLPAVGVRRIWLTASGGPFRTTSLEQLKSVTPAEACAHPNWVMGRKISVDSATMMNKGLEVIEACWLFSTSPNRVRVIIHPQSIAHSMVEYADGSVLAQLGSPDMRTPIAHALAWPERIDSGVEPLNLFDVAQLDFEEPDMTRFPCLKLAYQAMEQSGTATAILNAANEVAVQCFLDGSLPFTSIPAVIERTLDVVPGHSANDLDIILADDAAARRYALSLVTDHRMAAV